LFEAQLSILCELEAVHSCAMRYYFHVRLKGELLLDQNGIELNDIVEVRAEAEKIARELAEDIILDFDCEGANAVEVTSNSNRNLFRVMMRRPKEPRPDS